MAEKWQEVEEGILKHDQRLENFKIISFFSISHLLLLLFISWRYFYSTQLSSGTIMNIINNDDDGGVEDDDVEELCADQQETCLAD